MSTVLLIAGFILFITAIILINVAKSRSSDQALLEYEKNIRPVFIRYYFIGFVPLLIMLVGMMTMNLWILQHLLYFLLAMIVWHIITIWKLNQLISRSPAADELKGRRICYLIMYLGKILVYTGTILFMNDVLSGI